LYPVDIKEKPCIAGPLPVSRLQLWLQTSLVMAGKVRHLVNRSGRYHARLVVPKDLRGIVGKSELRAPLGGDYRQALKLLPSAVARLQNQIGEAERKSGQFSDTPRYTMAADQMAHAH
jgi:hypothetical protein